MIIFSNFSFSYQNQIFDKVNFSINLEQITILTGANGSGKTTLLRILAGLEKNYKGNVKINNEELKNINLISDLFILLKQDAIKNLIATTPYEDLIIWKKKFNKNTINKTIIEQSLKTFDIYQKKDTPIWKLSGGELKRATLSALLLFQNKYWLLDEPETTLDNNATKILLNILENKKSSKFGALITTHSKNLYSNIADRFIEIKDKRLI